MNHDPSKYYVNKVTEYNNERISKESVKWKIQQRHQNKSLTASESGRHDHVIKKDRYKTGILITDFW